MRVVLIQAPAWTNMCPPMAVASLAGYIKSKGYDVKSYDLNIEFYHTLPKFLRIFWNFNMHRLWGNLGFIIPRKKKFIDKWVKEILKKKPDIIGFSIYNSSIYFSTLIAKKIKLINKDIKIIFGGPQFTEEFTKDFLKKEIPIDAIVYGEGEATFIEIIQRIKENESINDCKGTIIQNNEEIIINKQRPLINLNTLPTPDFTDFDLNKYLYDNVMPISFSRGCIGNCVFCTERLNWKYFRYKNAENTVKDIIEYQEKYGTKHLLFHDSLINGNIKELEKLCDLIIEKKIDIKWCGNVRARKEMNGALLEKMKKAGCDSLNYGIESGSQKVLDKMKKEIDIKEAEKIIKSTHNIGIKVILNFIVGFPNESIKEYLDTLKFVIRNRKYIDILPLLIIPCAVPDLGDMKINYSDYNLHSNTHGLYWRTNNFSSIYPERVLRVKLFNFIVRILGYKTR